MEELVDDNPENTDRNSLASYSSSNTDSEKVSFSYYIFFSLLIIKKTLCVDEMFHVFRFYFTIN